MKELTKNRWKFVLLPALIIVVGIVMMFICKGFELGIEFQGGSRSEVAMPEGVTNEEVEKYLEDTLNVKVTVQTGKAVETAETPAENAEAQTPVSSNIMIIKAMPTEEEKAAAEGDAASENAQNNNPVFSALKDKYGLEDSALINASSASASFGQKTQRDALFFTLIAIICILIYIAIRFEWRSAIMAVIALAINVLVMAAVYAITRIPLNTTFIAAMLTVVGYSINNTIVIFDRIRENTKARKKNETIYQMVDRSVWETMGRTINSTITTLITIVLIYFIGVSAIKEFALPLIIGILVGAYTSIFIASTFWGAWKESNIQAKAAAAAERRTSKKK